MDQRRIHQEILHPNLDIPNPTGHVKRYLHKPWPEAVDQLMGRDHIAGK